jgi:hypothetical protein
MYPLVTFRGEIAAIEAFCKILGQRKLTLVFPRDNSEWIGLKGKPADIAKAVSEMFSINPEMEAELKSDHTTAIVTRQDVPTRIEQLIFNAKEVRLTLRRRT